MEDKNDLEIITNGEYRFVPNTESEVHPAVQLLQQAEEFVVKYLPTMELKDWGPVKDSIDTIGNLMNKLSYDRGLLSYKYRIDEVGMDRKWEYHEPYVRLFRAYNSNIYHMESLECGFYLRIKPERLRVTNMTEGQYDKVVSRGEWCSTCGPLFRKFSESMGKDTETFG